MANTAIEIPFYVAKDGQPLTGASAQMEFESLKTLSGVDKSGSAPSISEIGGGWYKFSASYGSVPFDAGDIVGVIDVDRTGKTTWQMLSGIYRLKCGWIFTGWLGW